VSAVINELLNCQQRQFLWAIKPAPAEPLAAILAAIDCNGGDVLVRCRQPWTQAGKKPAAQGWGLSDDFPVGLEENGGPANAVATAGAGCCQVSQMAPAVNRKQGNATSKQGHVSNAASVAVTANDGNSRPWHKQIRGEEGAETTERRAGGERA